MAERQVRILLLLTVVLTLTSVNASWRLDAGLVATNVLRPLTTQGALNAMGGEVNPFAWPTARDLHTAAYDSESDRMVVFGGDANSNGIVSMLSKQTWAYDLNTNSWAETSPPESPAARWFHAMAYDSESDRVILFGGDITRSEGGEINDTWAYHLNENMWSEMGPSVGPSSRDNHAMTYDSESDRIILFGGITESGLSNETWAYDFNTDTWTNMAPTDSPPALDTDVMAYDEESDLVVLFGGFGREGIGHDFKDETWAYDFNANSWMNMTSGTKPGRRASHGMAYDSDSDRVVLFGGRPRSNDTWVYDFNSNTWTRMFPGLSPSARNIHTMVYDTESDRVILFAGFTERGGRNNETWAYDFNANVWSPLTRPSPPVVLKAVAAETHVRLTWLPPQFSGGTPISDYVLYRGTVPGLSDVRLGIGDVLSYEDHNVTLGVTYHYSISAVNLAGEGLGSVEVSATPRDTTEPSITITSPLTHETLRSTRAEMEGTASDNIAIEKIDLSTDGAAWQRANGTINWSGTLELSEGPNAVYARATDTSGNFAVRNVTVFVDTTDVVHTPDDGLPPWIWGTVAATTIGGAIAALVLLLRRTRND